MATLTSLIPDVDVLWSLAPEELADVVLRLVAKHRHLGHLQAMTSQIDGTPGTDNGYPQNRRKDAELAVAEAWNWLVVHGLLLSTSFSRILGMEIPGENTVIGTVDLKFHEPVYVGDRVKYLVAVDRIIAPLGGIVLNLRITKSDGTVCVRGKSHCFFKKDVKEVRNGIRES